ncbi:MAG TPA: MBL fold metallo-hydrolase [Ktedonosporobacter sp.]|jgi:L-ascorbate metabolism protein UlaG (beta-lactamase superfamily)|nr:MBL fold metallo-hydrolase [Ktedonosporobacter sp.]
MEIHFLRHATFVITVNNLRILVDPMLSEAEAMAPIANAGNQRRIPMVELPLPQTELEQLLQHIDAVIVTHTHRDHWDARAQALLPKRLPILCQPPDQAVIEQAGFTQVVPVTQHLEWHGLRIDRTGGQHGTGELGKKMGPVSGFVIQRAGEPTLYIAGDTVWCPEVQQALEQFSPDVVILYTGAASYVTGGGPITMSEKDVAQVCHALPTAQVIAIHMETINHCRLTRSALKEKMTEEGLAARVLIPQDGELITHPFTAI